MRVLIVCSGNAGDVATFVKEQTVSLEKLGIDFDYFLIKGRGPIGYLKNYFPLLKKIESSKPDIIHAHYGLSGLLSVFQKEIPVVITFHGSDINSKHRKGKTNKNNNINLFSRIALKYSNYNIFVSHDLAMQARVTDNYSVIPCGVDMNLFYEVDKDDCRRKFNFDSSYNYVLFSSEFTNRVKNFLLAKSITDLCNNVKLIELKGFKREEVRDLLNACDSLIVTSYNEGSSQIIKEAMACNQPIVSTDVADIKEIFHNVEGNYITSYDPIDGKNKMIQALNFKKRTLGRNRIRELGLDLNSTADKVLAVYKKILLMNKVPNTKNE